MLAFEPAIPLHRPEKWKSGHNRRILLKASASTLLDIKHLLASSADVDHAPRSGGAVFEIGMPQKSEGRNWSYCNEHDRVKRAHMTEGKSNVEYSDK